MDYKLNRESLTMNEIIFDGCQEQPVDLDFSLPDYCPDIQRILKCQVYPSVTNKSVIGDRLELEGNAVIRVLYLDSGGMSVRCCESTNPFSASITLKQPADNALIYTKTRVEYINCRATSPRRLDIHGAFSVCAKVVNCVQNEIVNDIDEQGVQQKKDSMLASRVSGFCQQQFTVAEVLEIGEGKPGAETIVRTSASATVDDFKVVAGKIIVKGEVILKLLYASILDEAGLEAMEYVIPYSQMLDCDGITEDSTCDIKVNIVSCNIQIRSDSSGENMLFEAEFKLCATVIAYQDTQLTVVTDAYSTEYELQMDYQQQNLNRLQEMITDTCVQKYSFDLGDTTISKVIDVWNEVSSVNAEEADGQIQYSGKLNICILACNEENTPFYFERMVDFSCSHDWLKKPANVRCDADVSVTDLSYRIAGDSIVELKVELKLCACVYTQNSCKVISNVVADETKPKLKDTSAALTIYYADAGETLWNIARSYCTSVSAIKAENDLTEDTIENRGMLLIPM
jgi:LysM repeat protein